MATKKPKRRATKKAAKPAKATKPAKSAKSAKSAKAQKAQKAQKAAKPKKTRKAISRKASVPRKHAAVSPRRKPKKRAAPKKAPVSPKRKVAAPVLRAKPLQRRTASGHIDPKYAAELLARSGHSRDDRPSFLAGPRSNDDLAEEMGEEFVATATTGEYEGEDTANQVVDEEAGGPFIETTGAVEFARGTDLSNPKDAEREPFPKT